MKTVLAFVAWCAFSSSAPAGAALYGIAKTNAPVLNRPVFSAIFGGMDRKTLKTDRCGQVRELEFIALPGTVFTIQGERNDGLQTVYQVGTDDYAASPHTKLYIDSRFVELRQERPQPRPRRLPSKTEVLAGLKGAVGSPYVWGGNVQGGVDELFDLFYGGAVPGATGKRLALAGLDCSGLLYQATGGWTPRNTAQLISFGTGVRVAGKSAMDIAGLLEPLDLIVWNGHILIVLDQETIIESRLACGRPGNGGVVTTPLRKRLAEIMLTRRPLDSWPAAGKLQDVFVVRRWYGL